MLVRSLLIVFALAFFIAPAKAEEVAPENQPAESKPILISTVNIYNAKIVKYDQEKSELKIFFDIYNREKAQPQIMYVIQLIKEENGKQYLVDEKLYDKVISLSENQASSEKITYPVPAYFNGKYKVFIRTMNAKGMDLSLAYVGEADLKAKTAEYLEAVNSSCYLTIEGEKSAVKYALRQGVDIAENEKLIGHCEIINHYSTAVDFTPFTETRFRTSSGEIVADKSADLEKPVLHLEKNEKKLFSFVLPKALKPQAYDAMLVLKDNQGKNMISNKIAFHYVLRGLGATIQNLRLDKDYYSKGETAKISFFWTPSADSFPGSRLGETDFSRGALEMEIKNCSKKIIKDIDKQEVFLDLEIPIEKNCSNPQAIVAIKDKDGNILDQNIFDIKSENIPESANRLETFTEKTGGVKSIIVVIVLALTIISLAIIFIKKRGAGSLGIFLLAFLALAASGTEKAKAETVAFGDGGYWKMTYNISCSTCPAGEDIIGSASVDMTACSNHATGSSPVVFPDVFYKATKEPLASEIQLIWKENTYADWAGGNKGELPAPDITGIYDAVFPMKTYTPYCGEWFYPPFGENKVCLYTAYDLFQDFGNSLAIPYKVPETGTALLAQVSGKGFVESEFTIDDLKIQCGDFEGTALTDCYGLFEENTWVELTAYLGTGATAVDWTGCVAYDPGKDGIEEKCKVRMTRDNIEKVSVEFTGGETCALSVDNYSADGAGTGIITDNSSPANSCPTGPLCSWIYPLGAAVILNETPAGGSKFSEWGGVCESSGSNSTCTFACDETNKTAIAGFLADVNYDLKVTNVSGGGTGTVSDGVSTCASGATCIWPYSAGANVNLTASPIGGSSFVWSEDCIGSGACSVDMFQNRSVTATFGSAPPPCVPNYICIPPDCSGNCGKSLPQDCCETNCLPINCDPTKAKCGGCGNTTCACPKPSGNWKEVAP